MKCYFRDELIYLFRENGYSTDYLFDFSIATDLKNSTWRTIYFDQPDFGLSREYLVKGLEEENVGHYFNYMQKAAVLLGADPVKAEQQLRESLNFEIKLATNALPREKRRNASALYFPMTLSELSQQIPLLNWTYYVNHILTEDVLQVLELLKLNSKKSIVYPSGNMQKKNPDSFIIIFSG